MARAEALKPKLQDADWLRRPETQAVFRALQAAGYEVRAVGGAVRNALLGKPVADVDLATSALPHEVMAAAAQAGLKSIPTGVQHGTVTVVAGDITYEVTTLREDAETFGRHARVAFTADWAADARRRDFTINALYCDRDGTVHDPLGGMADLEAGRVVFIGEAHDRIREDYLRILRFFRFTAEYAGGLPDPRGLAACAGERAGLKRLSAERVRAEFMRLLAAPAAMPVIETMLHHGFLSGLLGAAPHLGLLRRLIALEAHLGDTPDAVLRLALLAVAVEDDGARIGDRLRLSNAEVGRLRAAAPVARPDIAPLSEDAAKVLLYRSGREGYNARIRAAWARSGAPVTDAVWFDRLELPLRWAAPRFPVSGGDLLDLGRSPGPALGAILGALEQTWIAGFSASRDSLLREARALIEKQNGVTSKH